MKNLISVIIPVYKVEPYINEALDSVLSQSYTNIEIILIDDGSPDRCGEICDNYAQQDNRISVHHIPNGGVAKARQLGVESAKGEFVIFVDPDDNLPANAIESLHTNMSDDVDMVIGSSTRFYESGKVKQIIYNDQTFGHDEWMRRVITITPEYIATPWAQLYRRELFSANSFPSLKRTQDWAMNIEVSTRVRAVKLISDIVYNYRSPFGTGRTKPINLEYIKTLFEVIEEILRDRNLIDKYQYELHSMQLSYICRSIKSRNYIDSNDEWIIKLCDTAQSQKHTALNRATLRSLKSEEAQRKLRIKIKIQELIEKIFR